LVLEATSCWMGGLWSDALGEVGDRRTAGIDRRCDALLRDLDLTARERGRALADRVPPPAPEEAYYPLRAVAPHIVEAMASEVGHRAAEDPAESANASHLVALVRAVAAAARETVQARRAADAVKDDVAGPAAPANYATDKTKAAATLEARSGIDALFAVDAGPYAPEARAIALLTALDRMEIARGLPKHLKIYAVHAAYADVFGVEAPNVSPVPEAAILSGTWLGYLTQVAVAAGHPVADDARDPQNREFLAWSGVLEGFADRFRAGAVPDRDAELARVEQGVITRLDSEVADDREFYEAHAAKDR
jgi:hypothetical protein